MKPLPENLARHSHVVTLYIMIILGLIKFGLFIWVLETTFDGNLDQFITAMLEEPYTLVLYFMSFYIVGTICMFPPNIICVMLSFSYSHILGPMRGIIFSLGFNFLMQHVAFVIAFLVGRHLFRDQIYERVSRTPKFFALNRAINKHGAWMLFLLRSSFLIPHPLLNYAFSVTEITVGQFILGNCSILPVSFAYAYLGTSIATLSDLWSRTSGHGWLPVHQVYLMAVGLIFICVCVCLVVK